VRLLDHIAQSTAPLIVRQHSGAQWRLTGASDFARQLVQCPLRYVLSDELVRTCIALAYSDGDELSGCLDLLHLPAEQVWIEWDEAARHAELTRWLPQQCSRLDVPPVLRAGVLISAQPHCRSGTLRTFWLTGSEPREPVLAAVETLLDLDGTAGTAAPADLLNGGCVAVSDPGSEQVDSLLQCARFRLDGAWQRYYQQVADSAQLRRRVMEHSLAAVAFDVPLLLALFLLMSIRDDLVRLPVDPQRLNSKRLRLGKPPLLEHLEICAPVFTPAAAERAESSGALRRAPRFHHVRGHIVRRLDTVYWRAPHWRGHVRLGSVRSRTVELHVPG
jgi:hypothetical protein